MSEIEKEKEKEKSINEQLSDVEKKIEERLQVLRTEYKVNLQELNKKKEYLGTVVKDYENHLCRDIEISISIAEYEEALREIQLRKNPSARL
jgi:peptidoglycan hydrolase CwlO-like protein